MKTIYSLMVLTLLVWCQATIAQNSEADANFQQAITLIGKGNYSAAIPYLDKAISKSPSANYLYYHRGNAKYQAGDPAGAKDDLNKSIALGPTFEAYFKRGLVFLQQESNELAISDMKAAYNLRPNDPTVNFYLGLMHNKQENWVDAMVYWDNFIATKPRDARAYTGRGEALYQMGEIEKAVADFKWAVYHEGSYIPAHEWLGKSYMELNDLDKSIKHYSMCVELSAENNDFLLRRAEVYQLAGNIQKACEDLEKAGGSDGSTALAKCDS